MGVLLHFFIFKYSYLKKSMLLFIYRESDFMNGIKRVMNSFAFVIISLIVFLIVIFSVIVTSISLFSFTKTIKNEYKTTTYHMTSAAKALIDQDNIEKYLEGEAQEDYQLRYTYLHNYCNYMDVTLIHVFKLTDDSYMNAINVFNAVNDKDLKVNGGTYEEWALGFEFGETYTKNYRDYYEELYNETEDCAVVYRTKNLRGRDPHITVMVPLKDSTGKVVALLSIQRPMSEYNNVRRPYIITMSVSTALALILVNFIGILLIQHLFVKPLKTLTEETKRFAKENNKNILKDRKRSKIIEIEELSISIDTMEDDMIKYIDNLTQATTEQKRMMVELNIAKDIQEASVPHEFPAFPDRTDFDLYAFMEPAKEVGGDFYNFLLIDDDHLGLVMADVSGKGVPAALFMMVTNILLGERLLAGDSPKDALEFVNNRICQHNQTNMFVTIWTGVLDLKTGKLVASNAGHDDPIVYNKINGFEQYKSKHGVAIGAMPGMKYENYEINLEKGDKIFLFTDGVVEATDVNDQLFGFDRLIEVLNANRHKSPKDIIASVKTRVDMFADGREQFDDITMLLFELKEDLK